MVMIGGGCSGEVSKVSEVRNELESMKKLHEQVFQAVSELEQRIGIILRSSPQVPTGESNTKNMNVTPLASELKDENEKLNAVILYIRQIKERCEL